ncbi:hypothetical protein [Flavobacterium frigoris]|uniref:Lipocalin-like domain-containing protein n=1 Tax=Flavobacterium frigoris (strain PS1) TaxID=1086011 RepID=H7FVE7_FLAFP|nr:hypothetical protein [Flavobacterium frigoris]EIA07480.1 hypothetical protein HJ01_03145 [Flavobacterium frigoris PS1]
MKKSIIFCALLVLFCSCSNDNIKAVTTDYQGKWELYQMSGNIPNGETTGAAMEWQEYYFFNTDGSFTKSRTRNGTKTEISGTYIITKIQEESFLELTYKTNSELIGSCYGNNKEELTILPNSVLSSSWKNCDGPGLEYKKTN